GKSGEPINYSTTARITELTNQGYEVVRDDFTKDGGQVFDTDKATDQPFEVVVREKVVTVTPEDPKNPGTEVDPKNPAGPEWPDGVKETDLNETVKRTIKYQYEDGSTAKPDVVETLTYKRTATVNLVTKQVTYGQWTSTDDDFDKVDTPAIAGYTAEKASVEAELDVPATAADKEVIVRYVKDAQKATITYKDDKGKTLGNVDEVTGKSGEPINYSTTARITELTNQGYEVVRDDFTKDGGQVFDTDKASDQSFTVVVKAKTVTVTPEDPKDPGTEVDPGNPDGPKWPDGLKESDLNQTVTRTIKYQYEDGSEAQPDVVETLTYKRTATVNLATKEVTYGEWTSTDKTFDKVDTPAIAGYTPDKASVEAEADVPATTADKEVIVTYVKDAQKATITYQDEAGKQLGEVDQVTGKSGEPINYSTTARITELKKQGYEVVSDGFTKEGGQVFDTDKATDQAFTVVVKERVVTVTPDDPKDPGTEVDPGNPDGPKYPDGVKESDLNQTVTRIIKYQYEDGSQAKDDVVETLTYKRTATVNLVTKEVTYGDWTSTDDDFDKVDTSAIEGYTADKASVAAEENILATAADTEVIVTYVKDAQKATITYQDEAGKQLGEVDQVTGKSGEPINYTTTARITELKNKGYEVVTDDFTKDGGQVFDMDKATDQTFTVVVKAKTVTVTPEDPKEPGTEVDPGNPDGPKYPDGVKESDLNQTVTRTIKYQYEDGSKAKDDVVETLTYKRTATVNLVTKEVTYGDWTSTDKTFDKVDTPAIAGYTPDKASVEAELDVPATAADKEVIIVYVKDAQKATIIYKDDKGQTLGTVDEVTGKSGEPINYTTTARITELKNKGYEVVTDDFTKDGGQVFDMDKATDQTFTVVVKAKTVTVTPEDPKDPGTEVDPGNPDGPKWPDGLKESDLNQTVKRTIKYQYEDGSEAQPDVVETLTYKRTATVNLATKEVTYGEWTSTDKTFDKVDTPAIAGYTPDKESVEAVQDVSATDPDTEVVVTYVKDAQKATITYKDDKGKQLGAVDEVTGKSGEPINYTTTARITELTNQGYEVVSDDFTKDGGQVFDMDKAIDQTFTVVVKAKTVTVTPEDPKDPGTEVDPGNPDGPKWPDGLKESDLNQTVTRTITYVNEAGETVSADVVQKVNFTRTAEVNLVTGEITYGEWTAAQELSAVSSPVVKGHYTETVTVAATRVNAEDADITEKVVYKKLGNWVPNVPGEQVPPIPYPNHPTDPSKPGVPTTPVVPVVPGYVPVGPDGNELPKDSNGNYIPPVPTNPGVDTPITYVADDQKAIVNYVDQDGKALVTSGDLIGKSGEVINYSTTPTIEDLLKKGYELVTNEFPEGATYDKDVSVDQVYTVTLKERIEPVDPTNPPKPGEPVDPTDPNSPVWPDSVKGLVTTQEVVRTITYVNEAGETVSAEVVQKVSFTRTAEVNLVTGEITYGEWTAAQTLPAQDSPVVAGYYTETVTVDAVTVNAEDADITEKVVYKKLGNWVPNIPGQPLTPIPYPNHPTDPSKPGTDLPVLPHIPGYVPVGPDGVTPLTPVDPSDPSKGYNMPPIPSNPTNDVPITYVAEKPVVPEQTQPTPPVLPTQPAEPVKPVAPVSPTVPASSGLSGKPIAEKPSQSTLPNTGDSHSDTVLMAGISLLLATIGMVVKVRREE
ncbi:TPA: MucBP domain-containing protein, partial [Streptococcus suis]